MSEISPELVERMMALIRDLRADHLTYDLHDRSQDFVARTAAIVAELPEPIDPDLPLARVVAAISWREKHIHNGYGYGRDAALERGEFDNANDVRAALAGIKRGRELGRGQ